MRAAKNSFMQAPVMAAPDYKPSAIFSFSGDPAADRFNSGAKRLTKL